MLRTVCEQEAVRKACDEACMRWTRAQDAWEGVTWAIVHDVNAGAPINEAGTLRALELDGARSNDTPTVWVLYGVDATVVTVHEARFSEAAVWKIGRA